MESQGYTVFLRWNEMGELEALPPCCATCRCRWMGQLKYVCIQPLPARGSEEIQGVPKTEGTFPLFHFEAQST